MHQGLNKELATSHSQVDVEFGALDQVSARLRVFWNSKRPSINYVRMEGGGGGGLQKTRSKGRG